MKKWLIFLLIGVALLIIIISGIFYFFSTQIRLPEPSNTETSVNQNNLDNTISPSEQLALDKCNTIKENGIYPPAREECYVKTAKDNKNPSICERFVMDDYVAMCTSVAPKDGSCDNSCIVSCANDSAIDDKADCYVSLAPVMEDTALCSKALSLGENKYNVYDECYSKIAETKKDLSPCDLINDNLYKASCYMDVAVAKKDYTLCGNVATIYFLTANDCYTKVAVALNDSSICEKIIPNTLTPEDKEDCYKEISMANSD